MIEVRSTFIVFIISDSSLAGKIIFLALTFSNIKKYLVWCPIFDTLLFLQMEARPQGQWRGKYGQ